jgi:zinc/manganese transport system substrate-binding protein
MSSLRILIALFGWVLALAAPAAAQGIAVVAAENFYGDVARQIGGAEARVVSIMSNPDQDPHLFETTPAVARDVADAQIVIYNGADYDPWMEKLLRSSPRQGRIVLSAAELVGRTAGDNPHLWYDPGTMPAVARAIAEALGKADPGHRADYEARLAAFMQSLKPIEDKIATIRGKYAGAPVTATEPVFGYMASALGLEMRNERFQLSVMNDTEPSARDLAAIEQDLRERKVKALFYNSQVTDRLTERLLGIAREAGVPVVGVTETAPAGTRFQGWMRQEIDAVAEALARPGS